MRKFAARWWVSDSEEQYRQACDEFDSGLRITSIVASDCPLFVEMIFESQEAA